MLNVQRRIAAQILKCGKNRVGFDPSRLDEIKEAITKIDMRGLINNGAVYARPENSTSKYWARRRKSQKSKGKQKGAGSRKGKASARGLNPKRIWINKIRLQRGYIQSLRDQSKITTTNYHELYMKAKGGFFRSLRHMKLYVEEKGLIKK
jgi:large subunit ribosomal protein L19e